MSKITDIISEVGAYDTTLESKLYDALYKIESKSQKYGLVFEEYAPEVFPVVSAPISVGNKVLIRKHGTGELESISAWEVVKKYRDDNNNRIVDVVSCSVYTEEGKREEKHGVCVSDCIRLVSQSDTIYPGLFMEEKVIGDASNPNYHAVINAENYDALRALASVSRGTFDAIYIDPPYNTGDKGWKYNNDYVNKSDQLKHSKWLSFMKRRLELSKMLLNPQDSVLIITIDDSESNALGMLLEDMFPEASRIQQITSVINRAGASEKIGASRATEYIYIVYFGDAVMKPLPLSKEWSLNGKERGSSRLRWDSLQRTGTNFLREDSPGNFYPIFVKDTDNGTIITKFGDTVPLHTSRHDITTDDPDEYIVWPLRNNGDEGRWQINSAMAKKLYGEKLLKLGSFKGSKTPMYYVPRGEREKIAAGIIDPETGEYTGQKTFKPANSWNLPSHDATQHGSNLINAAIGEKRFDFPKSLYAVEDVLRFFLVDKPDATVLDFFAGSGTTAHAVMRLNMQDGGHRHSISVTNNEVGYNLERKLLAQGLRQEDEEWVSKGIAQYATKPRIKSVITGKTAVSNFTEDIDFQYVYNETGCLIGEKTKGTPMSNGLTENAVFFNLEYKDPSDFMFNNDASLYPLLWIQTGMQGDFPTEHVSGLFVGHNYAILGGDVAVYARELNELPENIKHVFVHGNDEKALQVQGIVGYDVDVTSLWNLYIERMKRSVILDDTDN